MEIIMLVVGILLFIGISNFIVNRYKAKNIRQGFVSRWGKVLEENAYLKSVKRYHDLRKIEEEAEWIDTLTWNDLDMDKIFNQINNTVSSVGEEYLYSILHQPLFKEEKLKIREKLINTCTQDENTRLKIQLILSAISKESFNGISELLFEKQQEIADEMLYKCLGILPIIAIVFMPVQLSVGVLLLLMSISMNMIVHYQVSKRIVYQIRGIRNLSKLAQVALKLTTFEEESIREMTEPLKQLEPSLRQIKKIGKKFTMEGSNDLDTVTEYLGIMVLKDIKSYNKALRTIEKNKEAMKKAFELVGEIEVSLATASYREALPYYTLPELDESNKCLCIEEVYHPLIEDAVSNSVEFKSHIILTGSNASGKSSFIKAVAINALLAQTIYTCLAEKYSYCFCYPISSMAVKDNIVNGESYFIAEIKSIKRILDKLEKKVPCLCFIDEILKGTNTNERIAASTAIMSYIKDKNCLCIIATHDRELPGLLKNGYKNYHFREDVTEKGVEFDYKIHEGIASTTNAIKLLEVLGYDPIIIKEANKLASSS